MLDTVGNKDQLIRDLHQWIPSHRHASVGRPRTYIQQLCTNTGCSLEELPEAMDDRDEWRYRARELQRDVMNDDNAIYIYSCSFTHTHTHTHTYIYIYIYSNFAKSPSWLGPYNIRTAPLQRSKTPPNECPGYGTKESDGEVPVMLEL